MPTIYIKKSTPPKWNADGTSFGNELGMFKITPLRHNEYYTDCDGHKISAGNHTTCIIHGLTHHKGFAYNIHEHTTLVCNREEAVALIKDCVL